MGQSVPYHRRSGRLRWDVSGLAGTGEDGAGSLVAGSGSAGAAVGILAGGRKRMTVLAGPVGAVGNYRCWARRCGAVLHPERREVWGSGLHRGCPRCQRQCPWWGSYWP